MADPKRDSRRIAILQRKHRESNAMLAIIMAGIAALFIIGIIVAYNYAADTTIAQIPPADPPATEAPAETTGSGSTEPPQRVVPDHSQKQR